MPGKHCNGKPTDQPYVKNSQAYCEGQRYRRQGNRATYPKANNPYPATSQPVAKADWDRGWDAVDAKAGSTLTADDVKCCDGIGIAIPAEA